MPVAELDILAKLPPEQQAQVVDSMTPEQAQATLWYIDPERFYTQVLDGTLMYDKQVELTKAVRDNRRVSVSGCNGSGKDWTTGRIVLWWLKTHAPAKVVIIAPTHRQVEDVVWKETRTAFLAAAANGFHLGGNLLHTPSWELGDEQFAKGFSTDNPMNLQGFHSPHLLAIISEAHNVDQEDIEAIKRLNPECIVMTGNPFSTVGEFYDSHHGSMDRWYNIQIGRDDLPNVVERRMVIPGVMTYEDAEEKRLELGEDNPRYIGGVLGEFPDNLENVVVPLGWVRQAVQRKEYVDNDGFRPILGVDIARFGDDKTCIARRVGPNATFIHRAQGHSTTRTVGFIVSYIQEPEHWEEDGIIVVDDVGVGGGVTDMLMEHKRNGRLNKWTILPFKGGEAARDNKTYYNAVAEAWWTMRQWFNPEKSIVRVTVAHGVETKALESLMSQTGREYEIQSDARIKLEKKEDIKKRGGNSPDEADALAMTFTPRAVSAHLAEDVDSRTSPWGGGRGQPSDADVLDDAIAPGGDDTGEEYGPVGASPWSI